MLEYSNDRAALIDNSEAVIGAAAGGHIDVIKTFVERGCDINIQRNYDGFTALHAAVWNNQMKVVAHLLTKEEIDVVDRQDKWMMTPLHWAAREANLAP